MINENTYNDIHFELDDENENYKEYNTLYELEALFRYRGTYVFEKRRFFVADYEDNIDGVEDCVRDILCNEENSSWNLVQSSIQIINITDFEQHNLPS